jgi:alanine-synthesizing transaminase
MRLFEKSSKLDNVCYDIRGPVLDEAKRLESEGATIIKLNIGNPAPFGLDAPDEIIRDVMANLRNAQGYVDSKGLFAARKAIMQSCQQQGIFDVDVDDIYIGNGVSELIVMTMQGLLNAGDEILVPAPDYPLWTAAVNLSSGTAVHYLCDEQAEWQPDLDDVRNKITPRTKGIVVINPNNPTGAVYSDAVLRQLVELAREHQLIIFADEIYDKIIYDDIPHTPMASLADDIPFITFNGLSKSHRIAGFRAGWMIISGNKASIHGYIEGLDMLSSMRLCSNAPAQFAIQTALGGYQSITDLVRPGGRLWKQREEAYRLITAIPGVTCVAAKGAFYLFPKLDRERFNLHDDQQFVLDLLRQQKLLLVQGTGFNWPAPDHFRLVYLPRVEELHEAIGRLAEFLADYRQ